MSARKSGPGVRRSGVRRSPDQTSLSVLDTLLEGCQVISHDWKYLYLNGAVARQGRRTREELLGRTMMEAYPGIEQTPMFAELRRCMEQRVPHFMENEFTFPDGTKGWFELRFEPVPEGVFIMSLDITARRRAQEDLRVIEAQLHRAQKLEAVGQLAGGIAHDFNNIIAAQLGLCELALERVAPGDPLGAELEEIRECANRAARLTGQLLAFSRKQALEPRVLNLNDIVARTDVMLRRLIGEDVTLVTRLEPDLGLVRADDGQIEQVVVNLVVNARDAMPAGGTLSMETANVELDEEYARAHVDTVAGPHVMLAITDTGHGMDEATRSRLFEPFFTTKGQRGTGLGLATLHGIVRQSGGNIWVYSEPGRGTTFKIYLPRVSGEAVADEAVRVVEPVRGSGERLFIVEDDATLRRLFARMLVSLGYAVSVADNGVAALAMLEGAGARPDLLVTDVVLPGMPGPALVKELQQRWPDVAVLFTSGYPANAVVHSGAVGSGAPFLQKPFGIMELGAAVRAALGTPTEPGPAADSGDRVSRPAV
jgi:two-component system cell cycle sensor histidine kinase/response regulator CckA